MNPSRYLLAPIEPADAVPTVRAYGDQDDHLRLTVLLATALGERTDAGIRDTCTKPTAAWPERKSALRELLEEARDKARKESREAPFVRLVDIDALDMGDLDPVTRWNDATFRRERSELFALLLDRIADGGWELVRPEPREATTGKLDERDCVMVEPVETPGGTTDERRLGLIADKLLLPAIRPLADKLVANGKLRARSLARMLEAASSPQGANDAILEIAYDVLSVDAVEAGKRIATLRGPQRWNGVAGEFILDDVEGDWWTGDVGRVHREAAHELSRGGWWLLQGPPEGPRRFTMANVVREFLAARATTTGPERVVGEHAWLARRRPETVADSVEVHYHAVESGDVDLAATTALHYATDLRRIAYALSTRKDATTADYGKAASIYRRIVEVDPKDAYAQEYLAYNLAMQYRDGPYPPGVESQIAQAYARASGIDRTNPLYKGRELGFQARLGHDVMDDLRSIMRSFGRTSGEKGFVIFTQRVLDGMRPDARAALSREPWAAGLVQHPELRGFFS